MVNDDLDELYKLPLAEFTGARNALASRLKQSGRANDANLVKTLAKPSVSAWTVNQLYWNHREAFDRLLAAGQRLRGKVTDVRGALEARSKALLHLSDLATSLLRDAGHNPTQDMIRRVTTTLEALSALSDGPTPGRLTQDVDPPGFESLVSFVPGSLSMKKTAEPARISARDEETRQAKIAAAKVSLQAAKKSLADARAETQTLEAVSKQAEKQLHDAEERFKNAKAEAAEAARAVDDAKRTVEKASKELESLFSTK